MFVHKGPKVVHVIHDMTAGIFEYLNITSWKWIDKMWIYFEKVLKGLVPTKLRKSMLFYKEITKE